MPKRLAIVTGANKGIGYHCVEQLRAALPAADADVLLTSRNESLHTSVKAPIDQRGTRSRPIFDRRQKCLGSLAWSALLKQPCAL